MTFIKMGPSKGFLCTLNELFSDFHKKYPFFEWKIFRFFLVVTAISQVFGSIVVSKPTCYAGDRGSIPHRREDPLRIFIHVPDTSFCRFPGSLANISHRYYFLEI